MSVAWSGASLSVSLSIRAVWGSPSTQATRPQPAARLAWTLRVWPPGPARSGVGGRLQAPLPAPRGRAQGGRVCAGLGEFPGAHSIRQRGAEEVRGGGEWQRPGGSQRGSAQTQAPAPSLPPPRAWHPLAPRPWHPAHRPTTHPAPRGSFIARAALGCGAGDNVGFHVAKFLRQRPASLHGAWMWRRAGQGRGSRDTPTLAGRASAGCIGALPRVRVCSRSCREGPSEGLG